MQHDSGQIIHVTKDGDQFSYYIEDKNDPSSSEQVIDLDIDLVLHLIGKGINACIQDAINSQVDDLVDKIASNNADHNCESGG